MGVTGLAIAAGSSALASVGWLAQAAATPGPSSLPYFISGGGAAVATTALAILARRIANGELVPLPVATIIKTQEEQFSALEKMNEEGRDREKSFLQMIQDDRMDRLENRDVILQNTDALARVDMHLGGVPKRRTTDRRVPVKKVPRGR